MMNYIEKMIPLIKSVGDEIMDHYRKNIQITMKDNWSFYTNVDILSQNKLEEGLKKIIPDSGFIAEEKNIYDKHEFTWVIDPIDGTRNFARGLPYFGISVALMHDSEIVAGVVYIPAIGDMVVAQKGLGTWLNGKRVTIDENKYRSVGLLMVLSATSEKKFNQLKELKKIFKDSQKGISFRVPGAAALDLAYAAVGAYDVVFFEGLSWWDAAAGIILIQEAGGHVSDYQGKMVDESFRTLMAGNKIICNKILEQKIL